MAGQRATIDYGSGVFSGRLVDGCRTGRGVLTFSDGSTLTGTYVDDELAGTGVSYDTKVIDKLKFTIQITVKHTI